MKEFPRFFELRYKSVKSEEAQTSSSLSPRRKSLMTQCSVNTAGILDSFFNERQENQRARSPKSAFCILALGLLAITVAILVRVFHPYDLIFKYKLIMAKDGEIFNLWEKPPVDLYIKIYLFNITNSEAFLAGKEPMNVEQVGPYVYKEIMTHENVTFNDNNTMSARPSHPLVWQEHLSEGRKEDDQVVMLNIAMLAISHLTADKSYFMRMGLNALFATSNTNPIVRMTAKEFMFGYKSSLTTLGNTFMPNWIHFEKVGLIDRMYDFSTDYETFFTGVPDPSVAGLYATYRGNADLPHWNGKHCSNIEYASDGTKFKSFIAPNETVKFFRKSMCRPINLHREGELKQYGSLKGYSYVFEDNAFDNGAFNEENKCYCRKGKCQPAGLIDVTDCYYGFPISLSYPHFMHGDAGLTNNVTGLSPDPQKHSSEFVIQPESGLPLSLSAKIQINMHFNDMSAFPKLKRFSHLTAPMLWFEIMMPQLPESLDSRFNFYLNLLPYLDVLGFWGALTVGVALMLYAISRATLRLSALATQTNNISDNKFAQMNLLRSTSSGLTGGTKANGVYQPCEVKLIQTNEKIPTILPLPVHPKAKEYAISRNEEHENALMYEEMHEKQRRLSAYALEMVPALSSGSESSDEETIPSTSTSCADEMNANYEKEALTSNSLNSSKSSDLGSTHSSSPLVENQNKKLRNWTSRDNASFEAAPLPLHQTRPVSLPNAATSKRNASKFEV